MKRITILLVLMVAVLSFSCEKDEPYKATADRLLVTSITPATGTAKAIVFINGKNFSKVRSENVVKFNGTEAIVLEASPSQLQVVAPEHAETGAITVIVNGVEMKGPVFTYTEAVSHYFVSTVAGGGSTFGFIDGQGTEARFRNPDGVVFDKAGNLIITDRTNHSIRRMTPDGQVTTIAGTGAAGFADGIPGQFTFPWQSAIDPEGNIIVVEKDGGRIRKIGPDGTVSTLAGPRKSGTNVGYLDGPAESARLNNPLDAVVDKDGNIFIADRNNKRIRKLSPDGVVSTVAGDGTADILKNPLSLDIDAHGNLIVADANWIKKITPAGEISIIAGTGTKGFSNGVPGQPLTAQLGDIFGLTIDQSGNILFADASNHMIRMLKASPGGDYSTGTVSTIAGTGASGRGDGFGNQATFNAPYDVAVAPDGTIYVADNLNHLIRKITRK